jgi:hypothetical protein
MGAGLAAFQTIQARGYFFAEPSVMVQVALNELLYLFARLAAVLRCYARQFLLQLRTKMHVLHPPAGDASMPFTRARN